MIPKAGDVGVVVGRFQVHRLHAAHQSLIQSVADTHKQVIVVLGVSRTRVTTTNPLDFESRKRLILDSFPDHKITVLYIPDEQSDDVWSRRFDALIENATSPAQAVTLFGGRDSFVSRYRGRYATQVLEPQVYVSGTELRKGISREVRGSEDFRAGVIWAAANGWPVVHPAVDVAVYRYASVQLSEQAPPAQRDWLLVRKETEGGWRLPGGFAQPSDVSWEAAACRELLEETGVEVSEPRYAGSHRVDDWRYRHEENKIVTTLFVAMHKFGGPQPADDVAEARWFPEANLLGGNAGFVMAEHMPLVAKAIAAMGGSK